VGGVARGVCVCVFFFIYLGKGLQPVLHQTVYHGIFTVLLYKLEWFNSVLVAMLPESYDRVRLWNLVAL
jgi:transposase